MGILQPSSEETYRMGVAVAGRVTLLVSEHLKRRKKKLNPPQDVKRWMSLVADMRARHRVGDRSHTSEEQVALGQLAQWLVRQWHDLHGTEAPAQETYYRP